MDIGCNGKRATIVGTSGPDRIKATRGRDVIVAGGGRDRITDVDRSDLVCAGAGKDSISAVGGKIRRGGKKARLLRFGSFTEPTPGDGTWTLGLGDDKLKITCPVQEPKDLFQSAFPPIFAAEGDDTIVDDCSLADTISGGPGDDRITAGAGYDSVFGNEGNDTLIDRFSKPSDCVQDLPPREGWLSPPDRRCGEVGSGSRLFTDTEDIWVAGEGNDRIFAGDANDSVTGDAGDDLLLGGDGLDLIVGGTGTDRCDGGAGYDSNRFISVSFVENDCETAVSIEDSPESSMFCARQLYMSSSDLATCLANRPRLATLEWSSEATRPSPGLIQVDVDLGVDQHGPGGPNVLGQQVVYEVEGQRKLESFDASCSGAGSPEPDGLVHCRFKIVRPSESTTGIRLITLKLMVDDGGETFYGFDDLSDSALFSPYDAPGPKSTAVR